jgi:tetratricopeptide (TPR) repeat protein
VEDLINIAQSILQKDAEAHGYEIDVSEVKIFKTIEQDIDNDGQAEICFAAGIPNLWDTSICCLIDVHNNKFQVVEIVPVSDGFRDLQILDINRDNKLEIVTWFQAGSGAYLYFYIFQWDGSNLLSLFPETEPFHQGFIETKDLDADGVDEIVIWRGIWGEGAQWSPKYFNMYVFGYNGCNYELKTTQTSERCYYPTDIVSRQTSIAGTQPNIEHRFTQVAEYQQQLETLIRNQHINQDFVATLLEHQSVLWQEGFYDEAFSTTDLAIEAMKYIPESPTKVRFLVLLWRERGIILSLLGNYLQAVDCYMQAISSWTDNASAHFPAYYCSGLQRELGMLHLTVGDYEQALTSFSTAQRLLESLNLSLLENRKELSRLHSNFGLTYARLGEPNLAIASFKKAIVLDKELGNNFALAINYMGLGNIQRALKKYQQAIQSYQAALEALDEVSDRDRESDVYLELGSTLILIGQMKEGLQYLHKALLLTSIGNLKQREAIHYLYLGEAYRKLNQLQLAVQFFQKAITEAEELETPETKWQSLYGLAITYQFQGQVRLCQQTLEAAIKTIEQLRSQYLPETFKISLFVNKVKPYEVMILLCSSTSTEEAFDYMERAKSRIFIEQLATTEIGSTTGIPSELAKQEAQLIKEIRYLQLHHRKTLSQQKYEWGDEIAKIESQLEQLWQEICSTGTKGTDYVGLRKAMPLNFTEVKQILNTP